VTPAICTRLVRSSMKNKNVDRLQPKRLHGEEVTHQDPRCLSAQELRPGGTGPPGSGTQAGSPEDPPDGRGADPYAESAELTLDPEVAPPRILPGEAQDHVSKLRIDRRPAGAASPCERPLPVHQLPMPPQERLRPHQEGRPALAGQEPTRRRQEQPVTPTVPRPSDLAAQHGELMAKDGVLDSYRLRVPTRPQPQETAKDWEEDGREHEAAMVQMRYQETNPHSGTLQVCGETRYPRLEGLRLKNPGLRGSRACSSRCGRA
jgi:hypothetical protein